MLKVILTVGLPSAGKSFWSKETLKKEPGKWKRVNKDDLRACIDDSVWSPENEEFITNIQENIIRSSLRKGYNIIVDNTNFSPRIYKRLCEIAKEIGDVQVEEKVFEVDVEECIKRDSLRQGIACVGEKVIRDMYKKYQLQYGYPQPKQSYFPSNKDHEINVAAQNEYLQPCVVSDIDGTILQVCNRSPYDTAKSINDIPIEASVQFIKMSHKLGWKVIFVTGREERFRDITNEWIKINIPDIEYELFMRKDGDKRKDTIHKMEVYNNHIVGKYNIKCWLEDRLRVVKMLREELGLIVFQLNHKDF